MEIYEHLKKGVRKQKNKVIVFLCGAAGSGKTSHRKYILNQINFKNTFIEINLDDLVAFYDIRYSTDSRKVLSELLEKASDDGYSILYDTTCRYPPSILNKIESIKEKGYKIILTMNYTSLPKIIERVKKRTNQPIPEDTVKKYFDELMKNAEKYMDVNTIDEIYLFSNNSDQMKMFFSKKDKVIKCTSPDEEFYFDVSKYC